MKRIAKKILSGNFFLPVVGSKRCIFLYHDISEEHEAHYAGEHYSTTVESFKNQLRFLRQKFEIVPLEALVTDFNLSSKKHYASIVFDDGFFSVLDKGWKIIRAEQIPIAVFVSKAAILSNQVWVSNLIINKNNDAYLRRVFDSALKQSISYEEFKAAPVSAINQHAVFDDNFKDAYLDSDLQNGRKVYLDPEDIKYLHGEGVLIGSHSTGHYVLNKCTEEEFDSQIRENKDFLGDMLGAEVEHFALPFGKKEHYDPGIIKKIYAAGHKHIYTTALVPFTAEELARDNFLIPRIGLRNESAEEIMFYINRTFLKKYDL